MSESAVWEVSLGSINWLIRVIWEQSVWKMKVASVAGRSVYWAPRGENAGEFL